ncbi:MAG: hypothetical protein R6U96_17860 [Promethearchaeia archaeon]
MKKSLKTRIKSRDLKFWGKTFLVLFVLISWFVIFIDLNVLFNNSYQSLWIHCPSTVEKGEEFEFTVEAWDEYERLAGAYKGEIEFNVVSYNLTEDGYEELQPVDWTLNTEDAKFSSNFFWAGIFPAYQFKGADNGKKDFSMNISTPGVHYIKATDKEKNEAFLSNPLIVHKEGSDAKRLYWGDIHGHSYYSDGSGTSTENYKFARDVALLDFAALSDHSEMFPQFGREPLFNTFQEYIETTNSFNKDNEFATLVALEWTPLLPQQRSYLSNQHTNLYFSGDDMPFFSTFNQFTPYELYEYIEENTNDDFIGWTHHVLRSDYGSDFAFYNESINKMTEIFSVHGCGEFSDNDLNIYPTRHSFEEETRGYSVNDALRMGRKFGIMASSDGHDGRLGHPIVHTEARGAAHLHPFSISGYKFGAYPGGLTGLYTSELDRTHVFNALKSRSAYATNWINRHYMNFSINGQPVGVNDSTVQVANENSTRILKITAAADGLSLKPNNPTEISKIQIIKNSEVWKEWTDVDSPIKQDVLYDNETITGTSYDHCIKKDGEWYIHERSIQPVDPSTLNTDGADYYYVRMVDSNPVRPGMAWIGPIWVQPTS